MIYSWEVTHIEKYGSKGHGSMSDLSHSIYDKLINIMAKSVRKIILPYKSNICKTYVHRIKKT